MKLNNILKTLAIFCSLVTTNFAFAVTISYEATDLEDITAGNDLWQYAYTVRNHSFDSDNGFSIYFDAQTYSDLQDPAPSVNTDWSILVFQPDSSLPDDGAYDAFALTEGASLVEKFVLNFIWNGDERPGSQAYDLYNPTFDIVASELTEPLLSTVVPVPASIILMVSGLLGLSRYKK